MKNKIKILVIGVMIAAITIGVVIVGNVVFGYSSFAGPKESGMDISYDVVCTQGAAENLTGMERVKVYGTVHVTGDEEFKNIAVTVIFTDTAHDRVVRKTVVEGVDLLPDGAASIEFDAEYLRELTIPKTLVNETIQVNWIENGQLKTFTTR
ncbi:MAG: hypothetical protein DIAAKJNI_00213 [Candidatus Argoarchaeum ethanivorans]|uniref:DUF4352 domain-containing protein n=1 Tax=Candidatus Argoarchaeum ethanivorans TaxID=2608793 RepID=A0A811T481_9EURY|nr:MAG: hypothetical protein DIAAKJNI_00202 [Candidatus Argoarchaeum ethanivorans]CAD6492086.1 MAG: hypothetical protein DIAAKJNI_00213 [Candidatus Argoarchaeum ethanivorans]